MKRFLISKFTALQAVVMAAAVAVGRFLDHLFFGPPVIRRIVRATTRDVAILYRMGAGYPGDINRTHPFSAVPGLINATTPPRQYGDALLIDAATNSYRGFVAGDTTTPTTIAGVAARPYPTQQMSGGPGASFGNGAPPSSGVIDCLESGYVMVKIPAGVVVAKGGQVWVWFAANSGAHVQGAFEGAASAGNAALISNARFNGPADANGVVELRVWPA